MVEVYCRILNWLRVDQVDNNVIFGILMFLDANDQVQLEIFNLLFHFLTNYEDEILETVRLVCLMQISDYIKSL